MSNKDDPILRAVIAAERQADALEAIADHLDRIAFQLDSYRGVFMVEDGTVSSESLVRFKNFFATKPMVKVTGDGE